MATSKGVFVTLPEFLKLQGDVARSSSIKRTVNTLRIQPVRVFAFWVSPTQRSPAHQWNLHVASKRSNLAHFPIDHDDIEWQHATVQLSTEWPTLFSPTSTRMHFSPRLAIPSDRAGIETSASALASLDRNPGGPPERDPHLFPAPAGHNRSAWFPDLQ